jgi:Domain of unknown function (DUF5916)/Carbohydrate family 9 binding domain-like
MRSPRTLYLATLALALATNPAVSAAQEAASTAGLRATYLSQPPVIDGRLDDDAWSAAPLKTGEWKSYNPLHGDTVPQQTTVWVGYDKDALYFAFRCDDPEPNRIKTSVTRRDNIWSDDWVGLSLDALGTGQTSYHLLVNPSGIQLDMINTLAGNEDTSPDWVWTSAGNIDDKGYTVEIRLPLQTIRFGGGADVQMGILFWRRISRTGVSVSWPSLEPGSWVFQKHSKLGFSNLEPRPTRELIPSAVFTRNQERVAPGEWGEADADGDFGISAKWGLSSTITLDATVNPDFSQVESDAFQVEVNQRFPIFFSEKRPFFMEGAGLFNLAGNGQGDASMLYAVHTRRIVDPIFGAKLTGSSGRVTFGTLTAVDQSPGRTIDPLDRLQGEEKLFQVARAQVRLNTGSYAGAMATFTELAGRTNAVAGADLSLHFKGSNNLTAFVLGSGTDDGDDEGQGIGLQANYGFSSRRFSVSSQVEHYGREFVMDTAFMNRVGFTSGFGYTEYNFYPNKDGYPWVRRISPFIFVQGGRDRIQNGDDHVIVGGVRMNLTRQGFFRADRVITQEAWRGAEYDGGSWRVNAQMQVFPWLRPSVFVAYGRSLYYDAIDPFLGNSLAARASALFQIGGRFSQDVEFSHNAFDRLTTGERVYTVNLLNTRTTYQFSKELAVRWIARFDSQRRRVLTDLLGSYDLRPGTVFYVGYGSLYQKRAFRDAQWFEGEGEYLTTNQGLFLKASYLFRF